jgi:hypothetical protein
MNSIGQRVYSAKLEQGVNDVKLNNRSGIYFYTLINSGKAIETGKIVVEK